MGKASRSRKINWRRLADALGAGLPALLGFLVSVVNWLSRLHPALAPHPNATPKRSSPPVTKQ